ncbi:hypothetical protein [Actinoplanes sp. NBRC 103695]|uniref:hypothetical protein n=1 Tax=Actinoplanes sp. NBRC 103695 TaxID=3032202 RepID=UPI002553E36C|nr:hypothetical protein [Actinoplanes sp. NBRC 103695]
MNSELERLAESLNGSATHRRRRDARPRGSREVARRVRQAEERRLLLGGDR